MHRDAPTAALLGDGVGDGQAIGDPPARVEHHRPVEPRDLAGAQAGFHRQQDDDAVAAGRLTAGDGAEHATQHRGGDDLGLATGIADLLGLESFGEEKAKAPSAAWRARGVGAGWFSLRRRA